MGMLFFIIVAIGCPIFFLLYALWKRKVVPLLLGIAAFVISQMVIRIPLLQWVAENSSTFQLWSATKPIFILVILAGTAGIAEELARWLFMRTFLKTKTVHTGIVFGLGHGGIEAILLIGIPVMMNPSIAAQDSLLFLSGLERVCAMVIHVCLSLFVLISIRKGAFRYCLYAIVLHSAINFISGALAMSQPTIVVEMILVVLTGLLIFVTLLNVRRNFNHEKVEDVDL